MKIKLLIVTVLIMFVTKVHSSQTTLVQKSAEFAKASEGFQLHLREKFFKSESIPFHSNQIHLEFGSQAPFKDYVLEIKKGNKTWSSDLVLFNQQDNVIDFNTLLFGLLIDHRDILHLTGQAGYDFYLDLENNLAEDFKQFHNQYQKSLESYLNFVAYSRDFTVYQNRIMPPSDKLKALATKVKVVPPVEHQQLISQFIDAINSQNTAFLMAQHIPNASQREIDIYSRGLNVLYEYFDKIGNPSDFKIVQSSDLKTYSGPKKTFYVIELLNHQGRHKIEMEFFFADMYGERYIGEYDITGVHFS